MTHTHVTVRDIPPQNHTMTIGRMYQTSPLPEEPVFSTIVRLEDDEKSLDGAEVKVVRRGRRPMPKANEAAETK